MTQVSETLENARRRMRPVLYEADNLARRSGTGIATYARHLVDAAIRLGYEVNGLIGVERGLGTRDQKLNEILTFDAVREEREESAWKSALLFALAPFNALGGIRPIEVPLNGVVTGPASERLRRFSKIMAVTRLGEVAKGHFKSYGKLASLKPHVTHRLFHATQPLPLRMKGGANVYTIHDLVPLRLPYTTLDDKKYFYRMLKELARTADHIVTVSEHSKRDIVEFLDVDEGRVTNTYQAVAFPDDLVAQSVDEVAHTLSMHFGLDFGGYYLFTGAIEPKKNVSQIVDAYAASGTIRPLIIAGSVGWQNRGDLRKINSDRFLNWMITDNEIKRKRQVRRVNYVPLDQLVALIRGARAVIFPSIYEGFGLPVAEAMLLGTPVITSIISSLPEVAGGAALLVDPYSTDDLSKAIAALDRDNDLCRTLSDKGRIQAQKFSPSEYALRVERLYRELS